ncbi:MAG: hypothetical protein U5K54_09250 [Cytophagales bacterium]|nr:hypothetical protein [Cytophagales bacterium]
MKLQVNGREFMVNGMNWDYFCWHQLSYSLWKQPDDIIQAALDAEMSFLRNMGVECHPAVHGRSGQVDKVYL